MPLIWNIDTHGQLVTAIANGHVARSDFEILIDRMIEVDALPYRKLLDLIGAKTQMGAEEILSLGVRLRALQDEHVLGALALAVRSETFQHVARAAGILAAARRPMRIFDCGSTARRWLETAPREVHTPPGPGVAPNSTLP